MEVFLFKPHVPLRVRVFCFVYTRIHRRVERIAGKRAFRTFMRYPTQEVTTVTFPKLKLRFDINRDQAIAFMKRGKKRRNNV